MVRLNHNSVTDKYQILKTSLSDLCTKEKNTTEMRKYSELSENEVKIQ